MGITTASMQVLLLLVRLSGSWWWFSLLLHAVSLTRCHLLGGKCPSLDLLSWHFPSPVCLAASGWSRQEAAAHLRLSRLHLLHFFLCCEQVVTVPHV
ncbi:hypothetical protein QR685DRAFT_202085 [Neurospora intermedia]|uniref:Secreted protein n=1 Tax=Neurospora intermedia TaxID=5142 RepID=A0ABR3DFD4_NEUIN